MAGFDSVVKSLRHAEKQLEQQLAGIRRAISSLQFGSSVSPAMPGRRPGRPRKDEAALAPRRRKPMSKAARAKIAAAQRARWARQKAAKA